MAAGGILYDRTGQMAASGFGCSRETRLPGATENYPPGVLVAAAIDLGSALSGYAFAFWENPTRVFASTWSTRTTAHFQSAKTPTTLLLDPNGDFYAFGMEAEEKYSELTEDDKHHDWYYFQHFKMELYHSNKLTRHTKIKDISGKEKPAMEVFTKTIIFLKDKLYEEARISKTALEKHEIMWVITVPAIWSDGAKQFMRLAANNAGIDNYQLRLVLEPEAASLYCQVDVTRRDVQAGYVAELSSFPVGHKYILCDIGGGTADIATHEVCEDKSLRELFRASGDALGGNRVNLAFTVFLENFLGKEIFDVFKAEYRHEYLSLTREFEIKKRTFSADRATDITIMIPPALRRCIERMNTTIAVLIAEGRYQNLLQEKRDKLVLDAKLVKVFFNEPVDEIVKKLKEILEQEHFTIDSILLVGGFADSPYVLETVSREIRQSCGNIDIRRPVEAGLHVLKGAVFSILRPNYISERVSRYSYGFRVAVPYDKNIHPPGLKERRLSGREYCEYIFHKCISKGQRLKCGDKIKDGFEAPKQDITSKNEELTTELYRSTQQDPKYCTPEEDCTRVGKMVHRPPRGGWGNIVHFSVEITIGETELKMEVINGTTGEICDTTIDFLD